jgi:hypothetical protein
MFYKENKDSVTKTKKLCIAVDFDGTISTARDMGAPLVLQPNCKEVLERLYKDGVSLILWTCRSGKSLEEAIAFLRENDMLFFFCAINDQLPEVNALYYPDVARKVGADFYIDDRNLGTKIDWLAIRNEIYGW